MDKKEIHVVTGAFGFTGKYIAQRLLDAGVQVRTLTNSVRRENPFHGRVEAFPFHFDEPEKLKESLEGAAVLYNNYWVRFNYAGFSYSAAIDNTRALFEAARDAGVRRIVYISITNPSEDSPFEYFRGKALLERALMESGIPYSILRPAVIFGREDILINNIAWFLRRFPVFGVFGTGEYRLQPIYVGDLAKLAVEQGRERDNRVIDAVGPETFTYRGLVEEIRKALGLVRLIVPVPPRIGYVIGAAAGTCLGDVTITKDEVQGLMQGLLFTDSPPAGETRLSEWLAQNADHVGKKYRSELMRRRDREKAYEDL